MGVLSFCSCFFSDVAQAYLTTKTAHICWLNLSALGRTSHKKKIIVTFNFLILCVKFHRDVERLEEPVYTAKAHSQIINAIDGVGGLGIGAGAPEIITGSRDGKIIEFYMKMISHHLETFEFSYRPSACRFPSCFFSYLNSVFFKLFLFSATLHVQQLLQFSFCRPIVT